MEVVTVIGENETAFDHFFFSFDCFFFFFMWFCRGGVPPRLLRRPNPAHACIATIKAQSLSNRQHQKMARPKLTLEERVRAAKWREAFKKQGVTRPIAAMSSRARQEKQRLEQQASSCGSKA